MFDFRGSSAELSLRSISFPVQEKALQISKYFPDNVYDFISAYVDLSPVFTKIVDTSTKYEIDKIEYGECFNLVNLQRANDIRYLNKFFESINNKLPYEGLFIGCVETLEQRKERIFRKYTPVGARAFYLIDFIYKRIFPKWNPTRKFYFTLTKGRNRALSKAEILGRLISCGFEIVSLKEINGLLYFAARNMEGPAYDFDPTYGPFVRLNRVGKNGKPIKVYKFRTMHPFAEYLQSYVFKLYDLKEGGKFNNDFRITKWGRWLRKFWLDELPMIFNVIKGDLNLVGVRPLSPHYLSLYTEDHRNRRMDYRPGLIPPYYADLPKTLTEIMDSEARYFDMYDKNAILADIKYLWLIFKNIVLKNARSS